MSADTCTVFYNASNRRIEPFSRLLQETQPSKVLTLRGQEWGFRRCNCQSLGRSPTGLSHGVSKARSLSFVHNHGIGSPRTWGGRNPLHTSSRRQLVHHKAACSSDDINYADIAAIASDALFSEAPMARNLFASASLAANHCSRHGCLATH
jgi:hypothetical protein